ncbi:MAG: dTDP-4-dehydrorhamnose reductase [Chlamydiales bacterium]|jgi:dTDP-4-dehydrorhamnose reductase
MGPTLILGASGFLGAHVVASAVSRAREFATFAEPLGEGVVAVSRDPERAPRFCEPRDGAEWVKVDLAPAGAFSALLEGLEPARVICCAALARPAECEQRPDEARRMNSELPGEIAALCADRGLRLVHISTDLVFGQVDAPPGGFSESADAAPVSEYGRSKLAGEAAVLAAFPAALVVRLPLLYGNSGARAAGASDSLLEAVERGEHPPLFTDEWRSPLEVSNAAEAVMELANSTESGLLHVAGPQRCSRLELGLAILVAAGLEPEQARTEVRGVSMSEVPTGTPRPRDVSLAVGRARRVLDTELVGLARGTQRAMR